MGTAQSARGIQPGRARRRGLRRRAGSPVPPPPPLAERGRAAARAPRGPGRPPAGRTSPVAVRRDRLRVGLERLGTTVARAARAGPWGGFRPPPSPRVSPRALQRSPAPTSPLPPGSWDVPLRPPFTAGAPRPRRGRSARALPPVRAGRAAPPGRGPAHVRTGARGPRRCRQPTRPVLKHGPRSLTRARVGGPDETRPGAMKVRAGGGAGRGGIPAPRGYDVSGRTTGPPRPPRRGGGARARAIGPERW